MNEPRKVIIGQDFQANQGCRQSCRISHLQAGRCRCMAQLAAIPQNSQRLRETQRCGIDAPHAYYYPAPNALKPANEQLCRIDFGRMPVVEIERPQEFSYI